MKLLLSLLLLLGTLVTPTTVAAQDLVLEATEGATASQSATATESGIIRRVIAPREDITEPSGEVKGRLERYMDQQQLGPISPTNFIRYAIRGAVDRGVPANTIVLIILFPLVAALVAAARHLVGLRGFGIFTPVVLSVAFVATGVVSGILLFLIILGVATAARRLFKWIKMQYLPRMAFLLWLVALGVLATLIGASYLPIGDIATINIFPILILILLAENFIEVQIGKSEREAMQLTMETILLALISSLILSLDAMQRLAILNPELVIVGVAVFNIFVGRYVGLRFTEYLKFRQLLD